MLGQQFKGGVLCNLFNHSLSSLSTTNPEMLQCLPVHTGQLLCYSCRCDAKDQCCGRQAGRKLRCAFGAVGQYAACFAVCDTRGPQFPKMNPPTIFARLL